MKHGITKTAPRISDKSADLYRQLFGNPNAGMEYIGDAFPSLYRYTLNALKGRFSRGELMLMIDVNNGLWLTPLMAGQHMTAQVSDGIALDGLDEKWKIEGAALNRKVAAMTIFEAACLELWVQAFWKNLDAYSFEAYVADLAGGAAG
jgi:hypothetical protein